MMKKVVIAYISGLYLSLPFVPAISDRLGFDIELLHYPEYAILYFLLFPVFDGSLIITFLMTIAFGLSDELFQLIVPGRAFQWEDIFRDAMGGVIGMWFVYLWGKLTNKDWFDSID